MNFWKWRSCAACGPLSSARGPADLEWPAKACLAQPAQMPAHKNGWRVAVRVSPNPQPPLKPAATS
jgi:hypothetical protein